MHNAKLSDISFPVYRIGKNAPVVDNGVSFFILGKDTKYSDAEYQVLIIDDKNIPQPTLALRRLELLKTEERLFNIKQGIFFIGDLIKLAKKNMWFIDATGLIFQYEKSKKVPLIFVRIKTVHKIPTGGAIIEVHGLSERFKVLFAPINDEKYAGLLCLGNSHILYGLYDQQYTNTTRAV